MKIPIKTQLTPEQIILKSLSIEDISDRYIEWVNDPEITQFLEIRHNLPISKEDVVEFIANCEKNRRHHWGIFVKGEHVGNISCSAYNHIYKWVDISILIGESEYKRTGLGKLSLAGAIDHLFKVEKFHRVQAGSYANNIPSVRLFTRLGFTQEACLREAAVVGNQYVDVIKFGILESEWKKKEDGIPKAKVLRKNWEIAENINLKH